MSPPTYTRILRELTVHLEKVGWIKQDIAGTLSFDEKIVLGFKKEIGDYEFFITMGNYKRFLIEFKKSEMMFAMSQMFYDVPQEMNSLELSQYIRNKMHILFDTYLGKQITELQKVRKESVPILDFGFIPEAGE